MKLPEVQTPAGNLAVLTYEDGFFHLSTLVPDAETVERELTRDEAWEWYRICRPPLGRWTRAFP